MSECTEHLGDPLASKRGPGSEQVGLGGEWGAARQVTRNPGAHPPLPNPRMSLPEQTLGDWERVPRTDRILLWEASLRKNNADFQGGVWPC